jgi:adenylate cyclase
MTLKKISIITAAASALVFSILNFTSFFTQIEAKIYDVFLRGRPRRERFEQVVFLDVDDLAIAHVGVFPWPRSVMAEALLKLKEYDVRMSVFDIEYIDESPTQVDEIYLKRDLEYDFDRGISEIQKDVSALINAYASGVVRANQLSEMQAGVMDQIRLNGDTLYRKTLNITRNNDEFLAQSAALFGRSWGTLNLQNSVPLEGEQAERRLLAEEKFSYPVKAAPGAPGGSNVDILPAIPSLMAASKGAGFTNVVIDEDGIRRRIYLARQVKDRWYLQLAFAPIVDFLGNPAIELEAGKLTVRGARYPDDYSGKNKASGPVDIVIPLDSNGAMLLDWPETDYFETNIHLSFAMFSYLEEYQSQIKRYLTGLMDIDEALFSDIVLESGEILGTLEAAAAKKAYALEQQDDDAFAGYISMKEEALGRIREIIDMGLKEYLTSAAEAFGTLSADDAQYIQAETEYALKLAEYLETTLKNYDELHNSLKETIAGKICIIGRVDTGTTDIGVNPFFGEYINVGTHGVVMDTVLSQSFIRPLPSWWSAIACLILVPLIVFAVGRCSKPGLRLVLGVAAALVIAGASFTLFRFRGVFFGPLAPAVALAAAVIIRETLAFMGSEKDKAFYRKAFATYTSEAVAEQIARNPSLLQLGGTTRRMTAVFTDIRGFSSISEALSRQHGPQGGAENLVKLLNKYLTAMSDVVLEQQGVIDKYEGDAIIAFFGAPQDLPDHALRACTSAVLMKRVEEELNKNFLTDGLSPYPILTRIGINTGSMVVGNMGTQKKMDYTIMGSSVNMAARLEGVNKQYGTWILASEDTIKDTGDALFYRRLDRVRVVGIDAPVRLCEVMELRENASEEMKEKTGLFHEALDLFENREWDTARQTFEKVLTVSPDDEASGIFIKRCDQFKQFPPPDQWDGVFNLDQK